MTCTVFCPGTGNPGSLIVPQYKFYTITVFVWDKVVILKFVRNAYHEKSMKPTLPLVLVVLNAYTTFCDILFQQFLIGFWEQWPLANLSSAEGLLWASDVQDATRGAQNEGDFVRCPGHFGFSSQSFTKSDGFISLL